MYYVLCIIDDLEKGCFVAPLLAMTVNGRRTHDARLTGRTACGARYAVCGEGCTTNDSWEEKNGVTRRKVNKRL